MSRRDDIRQKKDELLQGRRDFLKTLGIYGGLAAGAGGALGGVPYVIDKTDDFDGEYTVEELDENITAMQGAEVAVKGYPSPQEPNHVFLDFELYDAEWTIGDFDLEDDDGWLDVDFLDDADLLDTEWNMNLYARPDGGASITIIDEDGHLDDVVEGLERGEIADRKVWIYGDVDKQDELYAIEVEQAEVL